MKSLLMALIALSVVLLSSGCNSGSTAKSVLGIQSTDAGSGVATLSGAPPVVARFDTTTGSLNDVPLPDDFLRDPVTGLNNLPGKNVEPTTSFDTVAGFSTAGPILIPFQGVLAEGTVTGDTVLMRDVTDGSTPTVSIDVKTGTGGSIVGDRFSTIVIRPLVPLKNQHAYVVVVTKQVLSSSDNSPVQSSSELTTLKSLEPLSNNDLERLRQTYLPIWNNAEQMTGVGRVDIPLAFSFTTQKEFGVLAGIHQAVNATPPAFTLSGSATTPTAVDAFYQAHGAGGAPHANVGMIFHGTLASAAFQPDAGSNITFDKGQAVQVGVSNVPFVATLPLGAVGPVPVLVFQHRVGGQKYDVLALADAASLRGFGVIAIDAVLHGERADPNLPSGTGFIDVNNLRLDRDHVYQSLADMFSEVRLVTTGTTAFSGGQPLFLTTDVVFVGQSLGAILGGTFMATEPRAIAGVLNVGGGKLAELFTTSPELSGPFLVVLGAQGIAEGTPQFDQYVLQAQTVLDDVDPFNYGPHVLNGDLVGGNPHQVLIQEMIDDQVVPNENTAALARAIAVTQVNAKVVISRLAQASAPFGGSGIFQFAGGRHGFLLDTSQGPTVSAQTQVMQFLVTGLTGAAVVNDAASKTGGVDWGMKLPENPDFVR